MRRSTALRVFAAGSFALLALGRTVAAQGPERPQPTCIQNVGLPTEADPEARVTLVLVGGQIEAVLPADAPAPPGTLHVDGTGLVAMPGFLDAYNAGGLATPEPVPDQDRPLAEASDVYVDMRLANRKGIQPAFRAATALANSPDAASAWREAGFGAALIAPSGQLLSGTSALATTREAAPRELVLAPEVFAHAAFRASGSGYPSTLMGYIAQLRQFFHDTRWQTERELRFEEGRPGGRPAFDADLAAARPILRGERVLACEAERGRDIERWLRLADQFGLNLAIVGGNGAGKVAEVLAARDVPVVLTLDWGKEVKDPLAKEKEKEKAKAKDKAKVKSKSVEEEEQPPEEAPEEVLFDEPGTEEEPVVEEPVLVAAVEAVEAAAQEQAPEVSEREPAAPAAEPEPEADEPNWTYETPLAVRVEERRLWEERRDAALRLAEAGVPIVFGTGTGKPKELVARVRTLVEVGLPMDVARAALTTGAARLVGMEKRLGRIAPGFDATLSLWTADPLASKDAKIAWTFVDGYPSEYEIEQADPAAEGEALDCAGSWVLATEMMGETRESTLVLAQEEDGSLSGTLTYENREGSEQTTSVSGQVRGATLSVTGTMAFGEAEGTLEIDGKVDGDSLSATATYLFPFSEEPFEASVSGTRVPEVLLELERHSHSCHELEVAR